MTPDPTDQHLELVSVAVPKPLLADVTAMLHRYFTGEPTGSQTAATAAQHDVGDEAAVEVRDNGSWTRDDIAELHDSFRNEAGRKVITMIAERSLENQVAFYGELMSHADLTDTKLRSQFSWFAKKAKKIKGVNVWPMTVVDAGTGAKKGTRYSYIMPPAIARWWLDEEGA
jgi:hypothetical protein